ncbi:MAG: redoxin family protein [Pseudomonadota bacterium]
MQTIRRGILFSLLLALPLAFPLVTLSQPGATAMIDRPAPEFTQTAPAGWINSAPLTLASLRGRVVLLDVWTFACWNCYRSFPWLNDLEARLRDRGLQVVGIHSPEFDHERDPAAVRAKVREFGLDHPVMLDNDFRYWKALGNRYWPAYYLIDKQGRIRAHFVGETHRGDARAREIEARIVALLAE